MSVAACRRWCTLCMLWQVQQLQHRKRDKFGDEWKMKMHVIDQCCWNYLSLCFGHEHLEGCLEPLEYTKPRHCLLSLFIGGGVGNNAACGKIDMGRYGEQFDISWQLVVLDECIKLFERTFLQSVLPLEHLFISIHSSKDLQSIHSDSSGVLVLPLFVGLLLTRIDQQIGLNSVVSGEQPLTDFESKAPWNSPQSSCLHGSCWRLHDPGDAVGAWCFPVAPL